MRRQTVSVLLPERLLPCNVERVPACNTERYVLELCRTWLHGKATRFLDKWWSFHTGQAVGPPGPSRPVSRDPFPLPVQALPT